MGSTPSRAEQRAQLLADEGDDDALAQKLKAAETRRNTPTTTTKGK